jgi:dihydrofolate reductase
MTRPLWHCHVAMSLDGMIARADGSYDWLYPYPPQEFGIDAYHKSIGCIVMGRATYEVERRHDPWPHAGRPTVVVTSRPLSDPPPLVEAWSASLLALAQQLEGRGYSRIGIEGGGQLIRGLVQIGRLDVLEMAIIPLVLGQGIPLFPAGTSELLLKLAKCEPKTGGALHVVYERPAAS